MAPVSLTPSPDVSPPSPSPPPQLIPSPAATPSVPAPPPSLKTSASTSPLSPSAAPFVSCGRSKLERWVADSPASSSLGGSPPSYRDIIVSSSSSVPSPPSAVCSSGSMGVAQGASSSAASVAADPAPSPAAPRFAPRITLLHPERCGPAMSYGAAHPGPGGWQKAESRGARWRRLRAVRPPRRSVPADLAGKCFNCLSPSHTAVFYRQKTRCFHCQSLGHRSYGCPRKASGGNASSHVTARSFVWRRIGQDTAVAHAAPSPATVFSGGCGSRCPPTTVFSNGCGSWRWFGTGPCVVKDWPGSWR